MTTRLSTPVVNLNLVDASSNKPLFPDRSPSGFHGLLKGQHLHIDGPDTVHWIKNGLTFRKLTYKNERVIAAEFATFENYAGRAAVVFLTDMAYVYFENGKPYTVNIPFVVKRVFSCSDRGLIMERDPTSSDEHLPKFYTLTDPIAELGLVVSSSTSAIAPQEQLLYFKKSICATYIEGQVRVYHARYLTRSKTSYKRHSRKRSSLLPRHDEVAGGDASLDQRLSFSRTETGALDRMGDFKEEESLQFSLDAGNMRKDIILTHVTTMPTTLAPDLGSLKVESLDADGREALAIVNKTDKTASIVLFSKQDEGNSIPVVDHEQELLVSTSGIAVVRRDDDGTEYFVTVNETEQVATLFEPFLGVESPPLSIPPVVDLAQLESISAEGNILALQTRDGSMHQFAIVLEPQDKQVRHCFRALKEILDPEAIERLRFLWVAAMSVYPQDQWAAFAVTIRIALVPSVLGVVSSNRSSSAGTEKYSALYDKFGTDYEIEDKQNFILCLHIIREEYKMDVAAESRCVLRLGQLLGEIVTVLGWGDKWLAYYGEESGNSSSDGEYSIK